MVIVCGIKIDHFKKLISCENVSSIIQIISKSKNNKQTKNQV